MRKKKPWTKSLNNIDIMKAKHLQIYSSKVELCTQSYKGSLGSYIMFIKRL